MRTSWVVLVALLLLSGWLAGCSSAPTTAGAGADKPVQTTDNKGLFPVLEKGMSTEAIREKLGPPAEIRPVSAPDGKAEVWVYNFEKSLGMSQVVTGTRDVQTFSVGLTGPGMVTVPEPIYSIAEQKAMGTLSLLIFNGQLAAQKAKVETRYTYN